MKKFCVTIACVCLLLLLAGCRTHRAATVSDTNTEANNVSIRETYEKEIERMRMVAISRDSAMVTALFKCDSNNQVLMTSVNALGNATTNYSFSNGAFKLHLNSKTDSVSVKDRLIIKIRKIYINKTKYITRTQTITVVKTEYKQNYWQRLTSAVGVFALVMLAIWVIVWRLKKLTIK